MTSTQSMSPQQLLSELESSYKEVETLWDRFNDKKQIEGFDGNAVNQAKNHITTARDSIKTAREVMVKGLPNG